ncbi:lysophospholipid acyltransferase family protein [Clostridium sediminicola]|uniref:lysophospholipid acyltransferase family protein n=1 Tax=Clostridium sediminicola TaxID=3114879 RepID=UPI0031F2454D
MIKLLWYTYFAFFLLFNTVSAKIKMFVLQKKSNDAAEDYVFNKAKNMAKSILKISKTSSTVSGLENIPDGPCVFVSNHQAIFDGFILYANLGKKSGFIAKKEIKKIPLVRYWLTIMQSVFIDRHNIREGVKAINSGIENLKKGYSMIIFPEGTRSLKSQMADFKKGSMKLAIKANVPIVPITVDGGYKVLEVGNKVRGNAISMIVHKPIYTDKLSKEEKKNLSATTQEIIENGLKELVLLKQK